METVNKRLHIAIGKREGGSEYYFDDGDIYMQIESRLYSLKLSLYILKIILGEMDGLYFRDSRVHCGLLLLLPFSIMFFFLLHPHPPCCCCCFCCASSYIYHSLFRYVSWYIIRNKIQGRFGELNIGGGEGGGERRREGGGGGGEGGGGNKS